MGLVSIRRKLICGFCWEISWDALKSYYGLVWEHPSINSMKLLAALGQYTSGFLNFESSRPARTPKAQNNSEKNWTLFRLCSCTPASQFSHIASKTANTPLMFLQNQTWLVKKRKARLLTNCQLPVLQNDFGGPTLQILFHCKWQKYEQAIRCHVVPECAWISEGPWVFLKLDRNLSLFESSLNHR